MDVNSCFEKSEIGKIPEGWDVVTLSDVAAMKSGLGITSASINEIAGYPCYGGNGLRGFTDSFTHEGIYIIIGRQGALCGNLQNVEGKFFASEHAIVVTPRTRTDTTWLYHTLGQLNLNQYSESSAQPGLSVSKLLGIPLLCPRNEREQHVIAEALTDVDSLLASLDRLIAKKRDIKQAAMQQLLTGRTRLPGFEGEWEVKKVLDLGVVVTGGTPRTDVAEYWGDKYPWITPTDISTRRDMSFSERGLTQEGLDAVRWLPANTVLVTCIASIGKNAILKTTGACNQQINAVVPNENSDAVFLYYLFEANNSIFW